VVPSWWFRRRLSGSVVLVPLRFHQGGSVLVLSWCRYDPFWFRFGAVVDPLFL